MLCVTRMNSISNGPTVTRSCGRTGDQLAAVDAVLLELRLDHRQRQRRAVDRSVDERQHVRHAADVILVAVRQHEGGDAPFLLQVREIRDDPIHAEQLRIREHHARVDDDRRLTPGEREHVHAELAESAERYDFEHSGSRACVRTIGGHTPGGVDPVDGSRRGGSVRLLGAPELRGRDVAG